MEIRNTEGRSRSRIASTLVHKCGFRKRMEKTTPVSMVIGESGKVPWSLIHSGKNKNKK